MSYYGTIEGLYVKKVVGFEWPITVALGVPSRCVLLKKNDIVVVGELTFGLLESTFTDGEFAEWSAEVFPLFDGPTVELRLIALLLRSIDQASELAV